MENTDLQQIFARYLAGEASPEELKLLFRELGREDNETGLRAAIRRQLESGHDMPEDVQQAWEPVLKDVYNTLKAQIDHEHDLGGISPRIRRMKWIKYTAAAAIALLIIASVTFVFFNHRPIKEPRQTTVAGQHDIAPGGNKAILTLADGTVVTLDSLQKGMVSMQGNTRITKLNSGLLAYDRAGGSHTKVLFNTISTPKGGQYQVVLSDGTKVWLNAASSVYFPNEFTGKAREVRITGEAYFEVAGNAKIPFKVQVNDITVQVLGTHFNVMAYNDEPVSKVTLLQGTVKVAKGGQDVLLRPGQQAQLGQNDPRINIENVDPEEAIAWTNNQFRFDDDPIQTVMRQLSRWYNVKVVIQGDIPQHFDGSISRNIYVSKVFEALQATSHLQYKIRDSTIIVSP